MAHLSVLYNVITYFILLLLPLLCSPIPGGSVQIYRLFEFHQQHTTLFLNTPILNCFFEQFKLCLERYWVGGGKEGGREGRENFSSPSLFSSDLATDNGVSRKNVLWAATLIRWPLLNVSDNSLACDFGHFNMAAEWNALYVIKPWSFVSIERLI